MVHINECSAFSKLPESCCKNCCPSFKFISSGVSLKSAHVLGSSYTGSGLALILALSAAFFMLLNLGICEVTGLLRGLRASSTITEQEVVVSIAAILTAALA